MPLLRHLSRALFFLITFFFSTNLDSRCSHMPRNDNMATSLACMRKVSHKICQKMDANSEICHFKHFLTHGDQMWKLVQNFL